MLASAPTWLDTGPGIVDTGSDGAAVAVAERPEDDPAASSPVFSAEGALSLAGRPPPAAPRIERIDEQITELPGPAIQSASGEGETARTASSPDDSTLARPAVAGRRTRAAAARARQTARRKGRARQRVIAVASGAIALVLGVTAYLSVSGGSSRQTPPATQASSAILSVSNPAPSLGTWEHIGTRAGDPASLALDQLFPAQFTAGGATYVRTAQLGGTDCTRAVFGTRLQAAVRKYGCSQVMRASYLSSAQKLMGTIGVLNLSNSTGAERVGKVAGSSQFIAQLTAATGPTRNLTKGTGLEEAEVKGHYLILIWAEFTTLRAPKTAAQKAQLKTFSANLINWTANISLTSRMVTGKP